MKLAEALMERADLNRDIQELEGRIAKNTLVQDGEKPLEDPNELLAKLYEMIQRLEYLMSHINLTNCQTVIEGKTITEWIAHKDARNIQLNVYRDAISTASQNTNRARGSEIKIMPAINVKKLQKQADEIAKEIRQLDTLLQSTNWQTELL